ncbi:MAG TPA: serine protease, partial [Chitinophagaceae bacterium]|nr:serine protease [Chitinophagaceae bacterium]
CHIIDRDSAFIRNKFILSTYQEVMDENMNSLQSSWGMTLNEEQKNLVYNTYGLIYSRVSSMILFDLKKEINILYRVEDENGNESQRTIQAQVISKGKAMPGKDIAILKIEGQNLPSLSLSKDSITMVGEQILVLGYPEPVSENSFLSSDAAIEPTLTSGIISAIKKSIGGWPVIQMDAIASHGSSGSPLCDTKGEVVGLTTFGSIDQGGASLASGFNFAIPVLIIREFLDAANIHPQFSKVSALFNEGLRYYYSRYYKKALKKFESVKKINSSYPQLHYYTLQCRNKINKGEDRQSPLLKDAFLVFVILILVTGAYIFFKRRKTK